MRQTPPPGMNHFDLLQVEIHCPHCGASFKEVIGQLVEKSSLATKDDISCKNCGGIVDLAKHRAEMDEQARLATELDKLPPERH